MDTMISLVTRSFRSSKSAVEGNVAPQLKTIGTSCSRLIASARPETHIFVVPAQAGIQQALDFTGFPPARE